MIDCIFFILEFLYTDVDKINKVSYGNNYEHILIEKVSKRSNKIESLYLVRQSDKNFTDKCVIENKVFFVRG